MGNFPQIENWRLKDIKQLISLSSHKMISDWAEWVHISYGGWRDRIYPHFLPKILSMVYWGERAKKGCTQFQI